jgi:archaellum component FlaD/FlaE
MSFARDTASFDSIPEFLKRTHCVKVEKTPMLNTSKAKYSATASDQFKAADKMFDETSTAEVIKTSRVANLRTTHPWIHRGAVTPVRSIFSNDRNGVKSMLQQKIFGDKPVQAHKKTMKRSKPTKFKNSRRTSTSEDEEGSSLSEETDEISEEEDEMTSEDEKFINDEELDEEDSDSDEAECEAEFSDDEESSSSEEEELSEVDDTEPQDYSTSLMSQKQIYALEHQRVAQSAAILQLNRRMRPVLTTIDTRLFNIIVSLFWAHYAPTAHDVVPLSSAMLIALDRVIANAVIDESDTSIGACCIWLINQGKLRQNLADNYKSDQLEAWVAAMARTEVLDDTPKFVYLPKKTKSCFLSGELCSTGVQLTNVSTKEPMATLWFDASNKKTNKWVLSMVRFMFLPATIAQFCALKLRENCVRLDDVDVERCYNWIDHLSKDLGKLLFQEGVTPGITAMLDKEFTRNYVN